MNKKNVFGALVLLGASASVLAAEPHAQAHVSLTIVEPVSVEAVLAGLPVKVGDVRAALNPDLLKGPVAASVSISPRPADQARAPVSITVDFN